MDTCKHEGTTTCPATGCECYCDTCQTNYEAAWAANAASANLCDLCGMPKVMTLAYLQEHQHTHFYLPCDVCKPAFTAIMAANHLCEICRTPLSSSGDCPDCLCLGTMECSCRECRKKKDS